LLNGVKNIYQSKDLYGEFLCEPLKKYHTFFARRIENSSGLKKVAWLVACVVTGIFAYPIFGALAGIGILIKLTGVPGLKRHNQSQKTSVVSIRAGIKYSESYATNSSHSIIQSGWRMGVIREFRITKQNVDLLFTTINQEIDSLSNQFKKIYIAASGIINDGDGEITMQLRRREQI